MVLSGNMGIGAANTSTLVTIGVSQFPAANSAGLTNLQVYSNINLFRNRLIFSSSPTDFNHCIYNNQYNLDNEGAWDGMKFNVYNGAWFRVGTAVGSTPTTSLFINSSGYVGIGTTGPGDLLHLYNSSTTGNLGIITQNGTRQWFAGVRGDTSSIYTIVDATAGAFRFAINSTGKVGINKANPYNNLDITGVVGINNGVAATGTAGAFQSIDIFYNGTGASGYASFVASNPGSYYTAIALQPAGGNVGIGTTSPATTLSVQLNGAGIWGPSNWSTASYALFGIGTGSGTGSAVGITYNTTSDYGALIAVQPNIGWKAMYYTASYHAFYIQGTSAGYIDGTGFHNASDEREKINIKNINTAKSLQRILACRPTTFQRVMDRNDPMISDDVKNKYHIGLIAQEVLSINPHCISEWKNQSGESRYGINYTDFVTHLIGAVQEHNAVITSQAATLQSQSAEITALQSTVATLEPLVSQVDLLIQRLAAAGIA